MKIIPQKVEILAMTHQPLKLIEAAGRTCYQSEDRITEDSAEKFVKMILKRGHDSVLEHASMTVRIVTDRGISHEIVRHRIGMSYSQESTRYVKYDGDMEFIESGGIPRTEEHSWENYLRASEIRYKSLIENGASPQWARSVLPNSLKTEIVVTGNFRSWRHFLKLRLATGAHPQIKEIARMIKSLLPDVIAEGLQDAQ